MITASKVGDERLPPRFWKKVVANESTGCWEWTGWRTVSEIYGPRYGMFWFDDKDRLTHRVTYHALVGPIPDGLQIDHLCRNVACCNPAHLEAVTASVNVLRATRPNKDKTHCPRGHKYTPENTRIQNKRHADGSVMPTRKCRKCHQIHKTASRAAKRLTK